LEQRLNLGFGNSSIYSGMAITSSDNALLSTATIKDFAELDSPLTVELYQLHYLQTQRNQPYSYFFDFEILRVNF